MSEKIGKMRHRKGSILIGVYIILLVLIELLVFNRQYIFRNFSSLEQQNLPVEKGNPHQLKYENGKLISQGIDPYITFENLNTQVRSIFIDCKNKSFGASGQVFYRTGNQAFSPQNSIAFNYARVSGYENTLPLPETQLVSDLRIDVTNIDGDVLACQDFIINPSPKFSLSTTRLVFYICLFVLFMLAFFKGVDRLSSSLPSLFSSVMPVLTKGNYPELLKNGLLSLPLLWLLLWVLPWATWLNSVPWLRLGLSLLLFATPGITLSLLLARGMFTLTAHVTAGLSLSVFWVAALGFTGRIFHWPFEAVKILFAFSGLILLIILVKFLYSSQPLYKSAGFSGRSLILLLFMIVFGVIANFQSRHSGDDLSYLAYVTTWQHAPQLDFREVNFGTGTADSIRFWWGMFPMSLALLAEISQLHGLLLLGFYLEPFLVIFAVLAIYVLYEDMLSDQDQAIVATLLQFTFFFLLRQSFQPGYMFFERLSDDKVFAAFILAPVFFLSLRAFLGAFHWRSGLLFFLTGSSLALTHPIILAYSVFIAGVYALIETILVRDLKRLTLTIVVLGLITIPSASLRFIDEAWVDHNVLGLEPGVTMPDNFSLGTARESSSSVETLISHVEGTPFYGFDLEKVQILAKRIPGNPVEVFLSWSYLWILGLGFLWSLFNLKRDATAPFIAATSFLVLLCAIPYTGWLVGYFVSARMLWRVPWLLPIGLISFVILRELFNAIGNKVSTSARLKENINNVLYTWVPVICLILATLFSESVYQYQWLSANEQLNDYRDSLGRLSRLGDFVENHIEQPSRFIAPTTLMNYLPGLSSKSKVVFLRNTAWAPYPVDLNEVTEFFSNNSGITLERQIQILDKYNVQYILTESDDLKDNYARNSNLFSIQGFDEYWIVNFKK